MPPNRPFRGGRCRQTALYGEGHAAKTPLARKAMPLPGPDHSPRHAFMRRIHARKSAAKELVIAIHAYVNASEK